MTEPGWTEREIVDAAASIGVALNDLQAGAIRLHLETVLATRRSVNLISERTAMDALRLHVVDSLAVVPSLGQVRTLVDIGSGAGFPGIPLSIALDCDAVLIESRRKRATFLQSVCDDLANAGFRCSVENARAEAHQVVARNSDSDAVVMRAVSSLPTLVELGAPYLKHGGLLIAMKGDLGEDELTRGDRAAEIVGLKRSGLHEYLLPVGGEHRALVIYNRIGPPARELPRREGRAEKSPLG